MIVVYDSQLNIFYLVVSRPWQDEQLNGRHNEDDCQNAGIAKDLPKLFLQQKFQCSHANLILKRLIAIVRKKSIIPANIRVSFQMVTSPVPFIITDLTIV